MDDINYIIFKLLKPSDAYRYSLVCYNNYCIFMVDSMWKHYCKNIEERYGNELIKELWNISYYLTYKRYHELVKIKKLLNIRDPLQEIYKMHTLCMYFTEGYIIPQEINTLPDLTSLICIFIDSSNILTNLKMVCTLTNLQYLELYNDCQLSTELKDQLVDVLSEIRKLPNLRIKGCI